MAPAKTVNIMTDTQNSVVRNQATTDQKSGLFTRFLNKCTLSKLSILLSCTIAIVAALVVYMSNTTSAMKKEKHDFLISDAIKSLEATLERKFDQLIAAVNATSNRKADVESGGSTFHSCKEIYESQGSQGNKAYLLQMDSGKVPIYCLMTDDLGACGGGGWTLARRRVPPLSFYLTKATFHYDSRLWSNKIGFNLPGGTTGFDKKETKLPTYWNTYFSRICLGMRVGHRMRYVVINNHADSLHSLIADGKYRATSLGRKTWKTLIGSRASLQRNCNKEGFNSVGSRSDHSKARIGILGNNQNDCDTCNSIIGFGTGGLPDESNTCGDFARYEADGGNVSINVMGYILVQ